MRLHELVEDVDEQPEPSHNNGNGNGDNGQEVDYDTVFRAVAKHFDCDPDNIDEEDEQTKKKVYDTVDQCWDSEENKVPDGCPVDIDSDGQDDENDDENGDEEQDDDTFEF